jgi:hypothetical protein
MKRSMLITLLVALAGITSFAAESLGMPAQIIIIRHGEKPASGDNLDEQGQERAQALVNFFKNNSTVNVFGKIAGVYAVSPHDLDDGSMRGIETISPTGRAFGLPLRADFTKKQVTDIASDIQHRSEFNGRTVVICWERKLIPDLATALGLGNAPENWDGKDVFDRAWVLRFPAPGRVTFQDIGEQVLPGDSL